MGLYASVNRESENNTAVALNAHSWLLETHSQATARCQGMRQSFNMEVKGCGFSLQLCSVNLRRASCPLWALISYLMKGLESVIPKVSWVRRIWIL